MSSGGFTAHWKRKRAEALGAFALLTCATTMTGCAATGHQGYEADDALDPNADFAVFLARVDGMDYVRTPQSCMDAEREERSDDTIFLCWHSIYDLRLTPLEHVAGRPALETYTFRISQHAQYRDGVVLLVYVKRASNGTWFVRDRTLADVRGCLTSDAANDAEIVEEKRSEWSLEEVDEHDQLCFSRLLPTSGY